MSIATFSKYKSTDRGNFSACAFILFEKPTWQNDLNPQFTNGLQVFVYAEGSPNTERVNGHYYHLEIYFSVDNYCTRDFLIGVTFGTEQLDKRHMDAEMDRWVDQIVREDTFPEYLKNYMKAQDLWEDTFNDE